MNARHLGRYECESASVASDIPGASGRSLLERLMEGNGDTAKLADLAQRQGQTMCFFFPSSIAQPA